MGSFEELFNLVPHSADCKAHFYIVDIPPIRTKWLAFSFLMRTDKGMQYTVFSQKLQIGIQLK